MTNAQNTQGLVATGQYESAATRFSGSSTHFENRIKHTFNMNLTRYSEKSGIFQTDTSNLWDVYMSSLSGDLRAFMNCNTCRRFIENFGGLVTINTDGSLKSMMWDPSIHQADAILSNASDTGWVEFAEAVEKLKNTVEQSRIISSFFHTENELGSDGTQGFTHIHATLTDSYIRSSVNKKGLTFTTVKAETANSVEDFNLLSRMISKYNKDAAKQALAIIKSERMDGSNLIKSNAEWLYDLYTQIEANPSKRRNLIWRAIRTSPPGFIHINSNMLSTVLDDILNGQSADTIISKYEKKTRPGVYYRPVADPTQSLVDLAEKMIAERGLVNSLRRRYARLDEIKTIWTPAIEESKSSGNQPNKVFGNVKVKDAKPEINVGSPTSVVTMSWEKFYRTVMPNVQRLYFVPRSLDYYNMGSILTASDFDAPPIIQWDHEDDRNPFSWYVYPSGTQLSQWNLSVVQPVEVTAISNRPCDWNETPIPHTFGNGVFLILDGARDAQSTGSGLFPQILRSDLHEIRSVIESYSRNNPPENVEESSASGLILDENVAAARLRVINNDGMTLDYKIDRWD